jgi:hypothetical protein
VLARLQAQFHEIRLAIRAGRLSRSERRALHRLGERGAKRGTGEHEASAPLLAEIAERERRSAALLADTEASLAADRADLREVASWVRPAVIVRGLCARLILRHRMSGERRALRPRLEALGDLMTRSSGPAGEDTLVHEVAALRGRLAAVERERERWGAPYGGRALPAWTGAVAGEASLFARAVATQLRAHLFPKAPAIVGLAVGWWIANTYTDSHLRSAFRSLGIGSGGTRVVSSSTYETMTFWLPLLAAALCAYLGERVAAYYRGQSSGNS